MPQGFQLVYQVAGNSVVRHFDQEQVVLGRSMVCDVAFDSPQLARKQAAIIRDGEGWMIRDLESRRGIAVNDQRVAAKRLAHGDRIVLAPDAPEPTLLEFRQLQPAEPIPPAAILSDEPEPASVVASIDLREFSNSLGHTGQERRSTIELQHGRTAGDSPAAPETVFLQDVSQFPVLGMFKAAGEILLLHDNLEEMLQQVVNLIAVHLPGRRSAACMYDQASGEIQPRCFSREVPRRTRSGELAAQSRRPFLISRSILQEAIRQQRAMLVTSATDDPRFQTAASVEQMGIRSAICVPLYHQGQVTGAIYVDSQRGAGTLNSRDLEVLTVLALMVAAGIAQISLRSDVARERTIRQRLARYNSPQVVEQIMRLTHGQEDEMLAEEHEVSVLFADITGFSAIAETWPAAEVVSVLNLVFERWTSIVFQREGTLDKYIGDAVMAVFGAPLPQADHAQRAVATALALQRTLDDLNRSRANGPALGLRIGINSGHVIAGDIGSPLHKAYTVIGDVVNIASRFESSVALPGQIVIGQATYQQVSERYHCEPLGVIHLRGKQQAITAYRVVGGRE